MSNIARQSTKLLVFRILQDSLEQAIQELSGNKLRSSLTLLGISIGIFCIIAVLSSVDSLRDDILTSFEKLGNEVLYVDRFRWDEDPGPNWSKIMARPQPNEEDLNVIQKRSKLAAYASLMVFMQGQTIRYRANQVEGAYIAGVTDDHHRIVQFDIEQGSYFSNTDLAKGGNVAVIGHSLAESLFPNIDGIGKPVKMYGQLFKVVGILKKEGRSLINVMPMDEAVFIPYRTAKKLVSVKSNPNLRSLIAVKCQRGRDIEELKLEITALLRNERNIKPAEKENFAVNILSLLKDALSGVFASLNIAGFAIGLFAMLVGAFSVANIMFVSINERTPIIGMKMAIGAKRYHILIEYLFEAIVLCIAGGVIGLLSVWLVLEVVSKAVNFSIYMSLSNIALGILISIITGIVAGFVPALVASRLDPVEAIRK